MNTRHAAFTLVELVMVIVIIGLLAAVVMPKFSDIQTEAQGAAEQATVAAVRSGINIAHMATLAQGGNTFPSTLDSAARGPASADNLLFTEVIEGGVEDANWDKRGTRTYRYTPTGTIYDYNRTTGKFTAR